MEVRERLQQRSAALPETDVFDTEKITSVVIRAAVDRIVRALEPEKIFMFGSQARGEATDVSDLDLLVVMESDESKLERGIKIRKLISPRAFGLDVLVYTPEEFEKAASHEDYWFNPLIKDIIKEGKKLYDRQPV
jgi:predicted nucleotidyltransferase